jgi:hypothetical protein
LTNARTCETIFSKQASKQASRAVTLPFCHPQKLNIQQAMKDGCSLHFYAEGSRFLR